MNHIIKPIFSGHGEVNFKCIHCDYESYYDISDEHCPTQNHVTLPTEKLENVLLVRNLLEKGFTEQQVETIVEIMFNTCKHCWDTDISEDVCYQCNDE